MSPVCSARSAFRKRVRPLVAVALLCAPVACERQSVVSNADSAASTAGSAIPDSAAPAVSGSGWDAASGPFVLLPTVDGGLLAGSLLRADATELTVGDTVGVGVESADGRVELFSRSGLVGTARLTVEAAPRMGEGCTAWPVARLALDQGQAPVPWTAAFVMGRVTAIPLDSIEGLAPRDSARLASDLTRLASGLRDDTSSTFRGLPFVVVRAWRSRGLDSAFVIATLARRVNQEDDPKEERLVIVVDAIGNDAKRWTVAWHERAAGHEEELVVAEPLLAFRNIGVAEVRLLFGRDDGVALGAAVLSRASTGWRVLWESAVAGCN